MICILVWLLTVSAIVISYALSCTVSLPDELRCCASLIPNSVAASKSIGINMIIRKPTMILFFNFMLSIHLLIKSADAPPVPPLYAIKNERILRTICSIYAFIISYHYILISKFSIKSVKRVYSLSLFCFLEIFFEVFYFVQFFPWKI